MPARIHPPTPRNLRRLAAALRRGELVAIPTETVYGLAAHALDEKACRAIFRAKRRPADDPLIVHVDGLRAAAQLAELNPAARALARAFWPGPLTLVLPRKAIVPDLVTSGQPTVALRSPAHPLARKILRLAGVPLAAPSANLFGYISPTTAAHVADGLGRRIAHILDGGPCRVGVESTIVDVSDPARPVILRPGAIDAPALESALRRAGLRVRVRRLKKSRRVLALGLLDHHYSPHTPLTIVRKISAGQIRSAASRTALLFQRAPKISGPSIFSFSAAGALNEVAHHLYEILRRADQGGFKHIIAEAAPSSGDSLTLAINDRLARAAGKRTRR